MPRVKRTISGIKILSNDEIAVIDEFINSDERIKAAAEEIKKIFRKHFCFKEEEIKLYIRNICYQLKNDVVYKIRDLCKAFEENDVKNFDEGKRNPLARSVFDDIISLFDDKTRHISESFEEVLDRARTLHIDPFKLAIKSNLENLTEAKFEEAIKALTQTKYLDTHKEDTRELFSNEEFKQAVEQCASIANRATSESVSKIFNLLNNLFWDDEAKTYVYDVREIIKTAPSILSCNPEKVENIIEMLKYFYEDGVGGRTKLLDRIKASPSILAVDFDRITNFNKVFAESIEDILKSKNNPTAEQKNVKKYSQGIADELTFDINRLTQIDKLKTETLSEKAAILAKYLGVDNAITCMQNASILQATPQYLELTLASIIQEESAAKINLRQIFVENPSHILNQYDKAPRNVTEPYGEAEFERGKKKEINVADFPEIFVSNDEFEKIKRKAGNKSVGISQKLIDKLVAEAREAEEKRKAEEARLAKQRAEEEAEYKAQRKQERERKKEEEREKKRLAKIAEKQRYNQEKARVVVSEQPKELTLEEKQALRRSKVPKVGKISDSLSLFETYIAQYEPIFEAFSLNGYFPKNLPRFSKIKEALRLYEDTSMEAYEVSKEIMEYSKYMKALIMNKEGRYAASNLMEKIKSEDYIEIILRGYEIFEKIKQINKKYDRVFNALCDSYKKNPEAANVFEQKIIPNDNMFMKVQYLRSAMADFAYAVEEEAEQFFGKEYYDMFFPEINNDSIEFVRTFTDNFSLNLNCNLPLIYEIYCVSLHELLFNQDTRINVGKTIPLAQNPLKLTDFHGNSISEIDSKTIINYAKFIEEEISYFSNANLHTYCFYNLSTENFIIEYQSDRSEPNDRRVYSLRILKNDERCHPGMPPAVISEYYKGLPLKCNTVNLSEAEEIAHFLPNEAIEDAKDSKDTPFSNEESEALVDDIIKIIEEENQKSKKTLDDEGEGQ